jgi:hypothetical protein
LPELDGLDLHGDENAQGPVLFAPLFAQAGQQAWPPKPMRVNWPVRSP